MDMDEARLRICRVVGNLSHVDGRWVCDSCGASGRTENMKHADGCPIDAAVDEMCARMYAAGAAPITDIGMNAKLKLGSLLDEDQHRAINNLVMRMAATPTPEGRMELAERIRGALPNLDKTTLARTARTGLGTPGAVESFRGMLMAAVVDRMRGR